MKFTAQTPYAVRFDWGSRGIENVANLCPVTVIVDVLSFSTCVDIACSRGAKIIPYQHKDETASVFAKENHAVLAKPRADTRTGLSLSPTSLMGIEVGTRVVLPSPNGSALTVLCTSPLVVSACLRNAAAVAEYLQRVKGPIAVVAAGERWADDSLRPCFEDLVGAGAVIHALSGLKSPEADVAEAAFVSTRNRIAEMLKECASGVELESRDFGADVSVAAELGVSRCVPIFVDGVYVRADGPAAERTSRIEPREAARLQRCRR